MLHNTKQGQHQPMRPVREQQNCIKQKLCYFATLCMTFALVTRPPYCPGRPQKLCFTTPSLAGPHRFDWEASRGKTKLSWSPGTIWPPCGKGDKLCLTTTKPNLNLRHSVTWRMRSFAWRLFTESSKPPSPQRRFSRQMWKRLGHGWL